MKKIDARTRYTIKIIKETFAALLKENQVSRITIKKLCDEAEINRATFYRYYEDIFDLYEKFKEDLIEEFFSDFVFKGVSSISEDMAYFMRSIKENADAVYALSNQTDAMNFMQSICERVYHSFEDDFKKICSGLNENQIQTVYYFIVYGATGIIAGWVNRGMEDDEKEIADLLTKLITNTLVNL